MAVSDKGIPESEFYMWRALFAFAFAPGVVIPERMEILNEAKDTVPFSLHQLTVLRDDFQYPQDIDYLYKQITAPEHKHQFCAMARAIAWSDGDMDAQDERILKRVSCLGKEDSEFLKLSRENTGLAGYMDQYAKNGMLGLWQMPRILEMRV